MKTLYISNGSNILIDTEENTANAIDTQREAIQRIYLAEEPMHVVFEGTLNGELHHEETDVKKGEILIVFYLNRYTKKVLCTVKSKEWSANIKNRHEIEQKEKEEWALKNANEAPCCECCDCKYEG